MNVKNVDDQCFKWAILSALFPAGKDAQRVGKYVQHEEKLDWTGLQYPASLKQIRMFERRNSVSVQGVALVESGMRTLHELVCRPTM